MLLVRARKADTYNIDYVWDLRAVSLKISLNTKRGLINWSNDLVI